MCVIMLACVHNKQSIKYFNFHVESDFGSIVYIL